MLWGPNAQAAAASRAWIIPGSFFYNYKILGESILQKVISVGGREEELNYIAKRISNRRAEMFTMIDKGVPSTDAYLDALAGASDLEEQYTGLLPAVKEGERLKMAKQANNFIIDPSQEYAGLMLQRINDARQQVLDAQKIGDDQKLPGFLLILKI